jgi:hypothetical protein
VISVASLKWKFTLSSEFQILLFMQNKRQGKKNNNLFLEHDTVVVIDSSEIQFPKWNT